MSSLWLTFKNPERHLLFLQAKKREARLAEKTADRGLLETGNFREGTLHVKKSSIGPPELGKRPKQKKPSGSNGKSKGKGRGKK